MAEKYTCEAQQRLLKVFTNLIGNEVFGVSVGELSSKSGFGTSAVFRDLQNLQVFGWAEQLDDGKWRLSVNAAGMLRKINDGIMGAMRKVNDARSDYQEIAL